MTISPDKGRSPNLHFLFSHPAHFFALGGGSGLAPIAPGTSGTLAACGVFAGLQSYLSMTAWVLIIAVGFLVGTVFCERTAKDMAQADPGAIVWDEIVAFWAVLVFCPTQWEWQTLAFCFFRFFDIVKPPPVGWADRRWKNGFGVMVDDAVAAVYSVGGLVLVQQWMK